MVAWGDNSANQCDLPPALNDAVAFAGGFYHATALKTDGTIVSWGDNTYGQSNTPLDLTNVHAVAAGLYHSLALRADGTVAAWGRNNAGQAAARPQLTNIAAIASGYYFNVALHTDGTVVAWGDNSYGQTNVPVHLTNAVAIAAGGVHALALRTDGSVVAWGAGTNNQGIAQNYGQSVVPTTATNVVALAGGGYHSMALRADGTVVAWGAGIGRVGSRPNYGQTLVPSGATNVTAIAAGMYHSLALLSNGTVLAWGAGTNSTGAEPNLGQLKVPSSLTNAITVAAGQNFNLALTVGLPLIWPQPPGNVYLPAGSDRLLSIGVSSANDYSCQWFFNGAPISGATGTNLDVSAFDLAKAGAYSVTVSNRFGANTARTVLRLNHSPVTLVDGVDSGGGVVRRLDSADVSLSSDFGQHGVIYYTLDGSAPDFTSIPYNGPITLTNSATIRSIAYGSAYTQSGEAAPLYVQISPTFPIVAFAAGGGTVTLAPPPDAENRYVSNTVVTVTAVPSDGWSFLGWNGDSSSPGNVTTVLMDRPRTLEAVFGAPVNVSINGNGQVRIDPAQSLYAYGSRAEAVAVPAAGSYLFGWAGAATGFANPLSLTVTNAVPLTALFAKLQSNHVSLTVEVVGDGTVGVSPWQNIYTNGATAILTAIASTNSQFSGWSGDATGSDNPLTLTLEASHHLTALFTKGSPTLLAPVITQQPSSQTLSPGSATTLSLAASGTGPLLYVWRLNGSVIAGATNTSLVLPHVNAAQTGLYDVVVTGPGGVTISSTASVTLFELRMARGGTNPIPVLILQGAAGTGIRLETSPDPVLATWTLLSPIILPEQPLFYVDPSPTLPWQRFYRAVPR